ncbi:MAG: ribbon-helix-helix protein, CopG family [Deltaproteobacteria bacterium]|nr:ribbon-helix-helix protein, CopG family [Deltaproteobacteria bacterium]
MLKLRQEKLKHRITVTLEGESFDNISLLAKQSNVSISWIVRYAVDNLLNERKEGQHRQLVLPLAEKKKGQHSN